MTKFNVLHSSFSRGMLSKRLIGATDLEDYFQGAAEVDNFICMPQGGLKKRPGTRHLADWDLTEDFTDPIPVGAYRPQLSYFYDAAEPAMFMLYRGVGLHAYSYTRKDTLTTPYPIPGVVDNFDIYPFQTVKYGDRSYLVSSGGFEPVYIERYAKGDTATFPDFTISRWFGYTATPREGDAVPLQYRTPYSESLGLPTNTVSSISGNLFTVYSTSLGDIFEDFTTDGVDHLIRVETGATAYTTFAKIGNITFGDVYADQFSVRCETLATSTVPTAGVCTGFRIALFGPGTSYPRSATAFQQRSVFGGTERSPDTLFGSAVSDQQVFITPHLKEDESSDVTDLAITYNIRGSVANTDPYVFNIASQYDTKIAWVSGGNVLYAGKLDEERIATGYDDALGPLSVSIQKKSSIGGGSQHSVTVDRGVFFITSDRRSVGFLTFNERNGQASSIGTETTAYGIVEEQGYDVYIKKIVGDVKNSIVFAHLSNGTLIAIAFNDAVSNFAWSKMDFDFEVVDIAYAVHSRSMNLLCRYQDSDILTLEEMEIGSDFLTHFVLGQPNYAITLDGAGVTDIPASGTITGFERFANRTITMLSPEGGVQDVSVSALGEIVLPQAVSMYQIGVPVTARVRSMRVSGGTEYGATNGRPKRVDSLVFDVLNSYGGKWIDVNNRSKIENFKYDSVEQYTGQIKINPDTTLEDTPQIEVLHDNTYPFILLNMVMKGTSYYD